MHIPIYSGGLAHRDIGKFPGGLQSDGSPVTTLEITEKVKTKRKRKNIYILRRCWEDLDKASFLSKAVNTHII